MSNKGDPLTKFGIDEDKKLYIYTVITLKSKIKYKYTMHNYCFPR